MSEPLRVESAHTETAIVRRYLRLVTQTHGKPRWPNPLTRVEEIEVLLSDKDTDPIRRLDILQERIELRLMLAQRSGLVTITEEFTQVGLDYSKRKGISYAAWRDYGVPASILKEAGIRP